DRLDARIEGRALCHGHAALLAWLRAARDVRRDRLPLEERDLRRCGRAGRGRRLRARRAARLVLPLAAQREGGDVVERLRAQILQRVVGGLDEVPGRLGVDALAAEPFERLLVGLERRIDELGRGVPLRDDGRLAMAAVVPEGARGLVAERLAGD